MFYNKRVLVIYFHNSAGHVQALPCAPQNPLHTDTDLFFCKTDAPTNLIK
uniref:Uncharacterized protein n=1 Tax=Anguilla anguilla TaxID=7936 RepID=A0A0E9SGJ0_ANGAN